MFYQGLDKNCKLTLFLEEVQKKYFMKKSEAAGNFILDLLVRNPEMHIIEAIKNVLVKNQERGSGVLPKGQHSWNISVMKEARVVVLEPPMECPSRRIFICQ